MSNRDRAAEVLAPHAFVPSRAVDDLADAGLLAPDPIPLNEDDRNFVIDTLMDAVRQATHFGLQPTREAWEAAANAFVAHTTAKENRNDQ